MRYKIEIEFEVPNSPKTRETAVELFDAAVAAVESSRRATIDFAELRQSRSTYQPPPKQFT